LTTKKYFTLALASYITYKEQTTKGQVFALDFYFIASLATDGTVHLMNFMSRCTGLLPQCAQMIGRIRNDTPWP